MNVTVSGRRIAITPALRDHVEKKLTRVRRHFDQVIEIHVILDGDHLAQKAEATCHVAGRDLFVRSEHSDLYTAIDALADKLDRQIVKHKDRLHAHPHDALKRRSSSGNG